MLGCTLLTAHHLNSSTDMELLNHYCIPQNRYNDKGGLSCLYDLPCLLLCCVYA
jgi:hypothetical protein